ncbi:MAG: hypothetical protein AAGB24_05825 [Bacteroidota bacterium]
MLKKYQDIIVPEDEFNRTKALRLLVDELKTTPESDLPPELITFLNTHETRDPVQAALLGIVLNILDEGEKVGAFARMFLILGNPMQVDLEKEVRQLMEGQDVNELYNKVTDLALNADPGSAEYHYGFLVLSGIAPDKLG